MQKSCNEHPTNYTVLKTVLKILCIDNQPEYLLPTSWDNPLGKPQGGCQQWKIEAEILLDKTLKFDLDTLEKLSSKWISSEDSLDNGLNEFKNISQYLLV